jgi:hypothetical protein
MGSETVTFLFLIIVYLARGEKVFQNFLTLIAKGEGNKISERSFKSIFFIIKKYFKNSFPHS